MEAALQTRLKSNSNQEWIERGLATAQLPDANDCGSWGSSYPKELDGVFPGPVRIGR